MPGYPQFSFWISITLVRICFFRIFSKTCKNTFELVGTVLKPYSNLILITWLKTVRGIYRLMIYKKELLHSDWLRNADFSSVRKVNKPSFLGPVARSLVNANRSMQAGSSVEMALGRNTGAW